ncbi:MAG: hypothetical protein QOJ54_385 [Aliidongia sp.]|jgi:hypothetical protein|nr:hypothetical protein [Aliidongia sp.]
MLGRLRQATWQDWLTPLQVVLGLSLLAIAIAQVPSGEVPHRIDVRSACAGDPGCRTDAR